MQKFIVTGEGRLKFGDVTLHKHLLLPCETCLGGGVYEFDYTSRRMLLSGRSYDFGRVSWDKVDCLLVPGSLSGFDIYYEDLPVTDFAPVTYV